MKPASASLVMGQRSSGVSDDVPGLVVSNGTIEALKWLALFLMTLDHVNKYLLHDAVPALFAAGRIAMPLFAFVLAYNLARPGALESGAYFRTMKRLALYGLAATPFFIGLGGLLVGWWPLNIMFMLLAATAIIYLVEKKSSALLAAAIFLFAGAFVEFWWFALAFFIGAYLYCKTGSKTALVVWVLAAASLYIVNRNMWAMAAMPLILAAPLVDVKMPRFRHVFYAYYPAHLAVILLIATLTGQHL